ncbi:MAG: tripartite tricarboxylate transporter permease [Methanolinea sp.]|jgi:putative membrane protein|nr:tripartite tricarboxylate transporter permease [Methanolinea sp.]
MMELLAGTAAGVALGTVSGLLPGIHVNTLAGIMIALLALLLPLFGPVFLAAVLVSALLTHCFLDAVPSTFLGIPDADTAVAVLPAHSLCLEGKGEEAVRIAALGSAAGVVLSVPLCLILIILMPSIQPAIDWVSGIVIIAVVTILALHSSAARVSIAVFLVSGLLGIFSFRYAFLSPSPFGGSAVLMPLLSGLFGVSVLLFSGRGAVPPQDFSGIALENRGIMRGTILGCIAGVFVGWLPGLSNATANGVLASGVDYSRDRREYILATSAANTTNALVGLAAFFSIERTRNGVVSALSALEVPSLSCLLLSATIAALAAYILTVAFAGMAQRLEGIDRNRLAMVVIGFVILVAFLTTGPFGLLVLALATAIGCVPRLLAIPQVFCMGSIMLPVMLFSFGIGGL